MMSVLCSFLQFYSLLFHSSSVLFSHTRNEGHPNAIAIRVDRTQNTARRPDQERKKKKREKEEGKQRDNRNNGEMRSQREGSHNGFSLLGVLLSFFSFILSLSKRKRYHQTGLFLLFLGSLFSRYYLLSYLHTL